ncbi:hypothetical protein CDAR_310001 [Caerostris darwini]|uniref:Uncharacterized protein n=1 Tax=Caerostris darwini TaxID=1538125 RepID=A0AAV4VZT5_9ARAC|nr:hypothetical protein CDAR_310001 [Caerostris darwini]
MPKTIPLCNTLIILVKQDRKTNLRKRGRETFIKHPRNTLSVPHSNNGFIRHRTAMEGAGRGEGQRKRVLKREEGVSQAREGLQTLSKMNSVPNVIFVT